MSAISLDDALNALSTDQIVLALLQQLAVRVDKLEKNIKNAEEEQITGSGLRKATSSNNEDLSEVEEIEEIRSPSQRSSNEGHSASRCSFCNLPPPACQCIFVKYGQILDGEHVTKDMTEIYKRYVDIMPKTLGKSLQDCRIAGIPADFRVPLCNFWLPEAWKTPESAVEACEDLVANGGIFLVADFDLKGSQSATYFAASPGDQERPTLNGILQDWGNYPDGPQIVLPEFRYNPHFYKVMPWKRLIVLEGLSAATKTTRNFFENYFANTSSSIDIPSNAITPHLQAQPSYQSFKSDLSLRLQHFHLSWYEVRRVVEDDDGEEIEPRPTNRPSIWGQGDFYGAPAMKLFQHAYTISAVYSAKNEDCWTILLLRPPDFTGGFLGAGAPDLDAAKEHVGKYSFQATSVELILTSMRAALGGWRTIPAQIDKLLGTGEDIFSPEEHDRLMLDDDQVSRSRKYFWIINFLQESENLIRLNIETWTNFRDTVLSLRKGKALDNELMKGIQHCDNIVGEMEKLKTMFKTLQGKTVVLRDGLFSGGSFMESRAATRLGENVMLLTYFTIFYLPLSFCTSVWSTASTFGFHKLAYTMVIIALSTYFLVFNINHVINVSKRHYRDFKTTTVTKMRADSVDFWKETGRAFDRYEPQSDAGRPSEWWIIIYQIRGGVVIPTQKKPVSRKANYSKNENTQAPKTKWYIWFRRPRGGEQSNEIA